MSFEEAEIIKRRAEAFLRNSEDLIGKKEWDLAVFSLEQYCQLILKYKMLVHFGTYPRTYSIRRLIKDLTKINTKLRSFIEDEDKLHYIARLEEAYVASRYFPYTYEEKETISLFKFVKEVFKPIIDEL
ncbi:HEPN domain-containing protein [Fervidicoccus sp.]|uniref:HEPN domain-containing protein n=1 Tax=Fervidicoccus sp. TaxID=2060324 RepID=UPI003D0C1692